MSNITIDPSKIVADDRIKIEIANFQVVTSYNWLSEPSSTILVPGVPPLWVQRPGPIPIESERSTQHDTQATSSKGVHPLEAVVRAVDTANQDLDFTDIDILTDRSSIRALFSILRGNSNARHDWKIEIIGRTLLISELETDQPAGSNALASTDQFLAASYRQDFLNKYRSIPKMTRKSTSYHHVVRYTLGGFSFLMQVPVDGYIIRRNPKHSNPVTIDDFIDEPADILDKNKLNATPLDIKPDPDQQIFVQKGGCSIVHEVTIEILLEGERTPDKIPSKLPDFFFSQTPKVLVCRYRRPTKTKDLFPSVTVEDFEETNLDSKIACWQKENKAHIQRLIVLLKRFINIVRAKNGRPHIVTCEGKQGAPFIIKDALALDTPVADTLSYNMERRLKSQSKDPFLERRGDDHKFVNTL